MVFVKSTFFCKIFIFILNLRPSSFDVFGIEIEDRGFDFRLSLRTMEEEKEETFLSLSINGNVEDLSQKLEQGIDFEQINSLDQVLHVNFRNFWPCYLM